ncbi:MAG: DUF445 family protein [Micrococcaceae bacterium]
MSEITAPTIAMTADDEAKLVALKKMRMVATTMLVVMAVIFVASYAFQNQYEWLTFVRAAAEGGMVGGLADWFAVTALFKHPMGLKIPHTAIIPRKKDEIGESLSKFVETNFLSEQVVLSKLNSFSVSQKIGEYILEGDNAEKLTNQVADGARGAMNVLKDEDIQDMIENMVKEHVVKPEWGPYLGKLGASVLADGHHHKLVDILVDRVYDWAEKNKDTVANVVEDRSPTWMPKFAENFVGDKVHNELVGFLKAVRNDPLHDVRMAIDRYLMDLTQDLQHDPAMIQKVEDLKSSVLGDDRLRELAGDAWGSIKDVLTQEIEKDNGQIRTKVKDTIIEFGERLESDPSWGHKIDNWIRAAALNIIKNYRSDIAAIIKDTVEQWDAKETSEKIELQVGKDLQFIRINGTVVGALAGLVITLIAHFVLGH